MRYKYPSGMIMPFDVACPSGWTRVSALDDKFLCGASTYGATGGTTSHDHTFNPGAANVESSSVHLSDWGSQMIAVLNFHYHSINIPTATSGEGDHTPPYINMIFCKKD